MDINEQLYKEARKRVEKKKSFFKHLVTYLVMSVFFFFINITTSPSHLWFIYPMLGWGLGLAFHGFEVFGFSRLDKDWEDREIAKELHSMNRRLGQGKYQLPEEEDHQVDFLDLDNDHDTKRRRKEDFSRYDNYDPRDMRELRDEFKDKNKL